MAVIAMITKHRLVANTASTPSNPDDSPMVARTDKILRCRQVYNVAQPSALFGSSGADKTIDAVEKFASLTF